jgi:hypothetical protein
MKLLSAILTGALVLGLALPAAADQNDHGGPRPLQDGHQSMDPRTPTSPSLAQLIATGERGENPAVAAVARKAYQELLAGNIDQVKLTSDLAAAWTPSLEEAASKQLSALGTPSWSFLGNTFTQAGSVAVYRLAYPSSTVFLSVGVGDNGTVYALRLGSSLPQPAI